MASSEDIDAAAALARSEAEATAIRGRAEVDADAIRARALVDADAIRARAELEAEEARERADRDRARARRILEDARHEAEAMVADADEARKAGRQTLDRLLATRADLHEAIERLTEMTQPVLDLTDGVGTVRLEADLDSLGDIDVVPLGAPLAPVGVAAEMADDGDPVARFVRSALARAADSATQPGETEPWAGQLPSRKREELRNGRTVL